ncbi:MAG: hypothetical protein IPL78_36225, partial [Chloroflexi bacterium]|nr:hypothetical protein [Chloroflexota bacterium]
VTAGDGVVGAAQADVDLEVERVFPGLVTEGAEKWPVRVNGDAPAMVGVVEPEDVVDKFGGDDEVRG